MYLQWRLCEGAMVMEEGEMAWIKIMMCLRD